MLKPLTNYGFDELYLKHYISQFTLPKVVDFCIKKYYFYYFIRGTSIPEACWVRYLIFHSFL